MNVMLTKTCLNYYKYVYMNYSTLCTLTLLLTDFMFIESLNNIRLITENNIYCALWYSALATFEVGLGNMMLQVEIYYIIKVKHNLYRMPTYFNDKSFPFFKGRY